MGSRMNAREPNMSEETIYTTIETEKRSKSTKKRIIRNTWRGCAVQVNCYDSEGRLQHTETDKHTYQDTDTEHYHWTDRDQPPLIPPPDYAKQVEPFSENRLYTTTQLNKDGSLLMVKSTEIASAPVVHWTGETSCRSTIESDGKEFDEQLNEARNKTFYPAIQAAGGGSVGHPKVPPAVYATDPPLEHGDMVLSHTVKAGPATREIEYKTREDLDGKKWSRTKETLWVAKDAYINPNLAISFGTNVTQKGRSHGFSQKPTENGGLTVEDRRKMRREASRAMYAIVGKDF